MHTDKELLLIMEFRSVFLRDLLLFLDKEFVVSCLPLCRLTISPITRRSECREKAIVLYSDYCEMFVNTCVR